MVRPRLMVVALVALVAGTVLVGACGSSAPAPTTNQLVPDLSILEQQQGFTKAQVQCVATHARAELEGQDLRQFATDLKGLKATGTTTGMTPTSLKTFTAAIAACATAG